jgi:hypothetical protein
MNSFGTAKAEVLLLQKSKRQVTKMLKIFGHLPQDLDAVAILTPKNF